MDQIEFKMKAPNHLEFLKIMDTRKRMVVFRKAPCEHVSQN
uniref:Uncharacterized protein n=1 Tax=Rhizophora mucronata TaxID=61149 RepID=A0A2P2PNC7_RHIMU